MMACPQAPQVLSLISCCDLRLAQRLKGSVIVAIGVTRCSCFEPRALMASFETHVGSSETQNGAKKWCEAH